MFGFGKKCSKQDDLQDQQREEDLQHLRARYAAYEEEYLETSKIPDLGQRYLALQQLVADIEEDIDLVDKDLRGGEETNKNVNKLMARMGASAAGMASSMPLAAVDSTVAVVVGAASLATALISKIRFDFGTFAQDKRYLNELVCRESYFNASNLLLKKIKKECAALPVNDPFRFAKSEFFDVIVEQEPALLQNFDRAALRERLKAAEPESKKCHPKKNPGLEL